MKAGWTTALPCLMAVLSAADDSGVAWRGETPFFDAHVALTDGLREGNRLLQPDEFER